MKVYYAYHMKVYYAYHMKVYYAYQIPCILHCSLHPPLIQPWVVNLDASTNVFANLVMMVFNNSSKV